MEPLSQEQINTAKSFTPEQRDIYSRSRSAGISPQAAFNAVLIKSGKTTPTVAPTKEDGIITGKNSLVSNVGDAVVNALSPKNFVNEVKSNINKYGLMQGITRAPLTGAAQLGRGVGKIVEAGLETVDDLTGERISGAIMPTIEGIVQSPLGTTIFEAATDFNNFTGGVAGDVLDASNLLAIPGIVRTGATTATRTAVNQLDDVARAANTVARGTRPLKEFMPSFGDRIIEGGMKVLDTVREIPEGISNAAKRSIDSRIQRIATTQPAKASESLVDLYKKAIVPGVKGKRKTIANIENIERNVQNEIPRLAKKYELDDGFEIEGFANAISSEKKDIFKNIEAGLTQAGDEGRIISTESAVKALDELASSERAGANSTLRNAIAKAKAELVDATPDGQFVQYKTFSPSGAQDIIADINAKLQAFYKGSSAGNTADVIVDNLVVNNLKKSVDDVVENLGEGTFKELKSRYSALKSMEDDVVHRAVFEAQKGRGLSDLTDILSAGDIAAGTLDPAFLLRGASSFLTKEVIKSLTDKNELVRQMFLYGKYLD